MNSTEILEINPGSRTSGDWKRVLIHLTEELSKALAVKINTHSWNVNDDQIGDASACNCVDVSAVVNAALAIEVSGVLSVTINFGEAVWVSCNLLLFVSGLRVTGNGDYFALSFSEHGWQNQGWVKDEFGEWQ